MFELKEITQEVTNETELSWKDYLDEVEEYSTWGYEAVLHTMNPNHETERKKYALVRAGSNVAEAVIFFTHKFPMPVNHSESALKVLEIRTHPKYDSRNPTADGDSVLQRRTRVVAVLSHLLTEIVGLTYEVFKARKVKVYANKQADADFFAHLQESLRKEDPEELLAFNFSSHGNWFEIIKVET